MNIESYTIFKKILIDPYTKDALVYDASSSTFQNEINNNLYQINNNVCVFINDKNAKDEEFKYIEHYQNDGEVFDYTAEGRNKSIVCEEVRLQQSIASYINIKPTITILDIGCGNGWVAKKFSGKGCNVISIDISLTNTSRIKKQVPNNNHIAIVADVYNLPIKENSVDYVIASEIMEHVINPKLFIESLYKVLNDNGELIITTPYNEVIEHSLCIHCNKKTPKSAHLHSFNEKNITQYIPNHIAKYDSFGIHNLAFIKLKFHRIFNFLPVKIWLFIDNLGNLIYKKPYRLILKFKKRF